MRPCSSCEVDDGKVRSCPSPAVYRLVMSWTPLIDRFVCALHRPPDKRGLIAIVFVGDWDVSGTVVSLEALRERRRMAATK